MAETIPETKSSGSETLNDICIDLSAELKDRLIDIYDSKMKWEMSSLSLGGFSTRLPEVDMEIITRPGVSIGGNELRVSVPLEGRYGSLSSAEDISESWAVQINGNLPDAYGYFGRTPPQEYGAKFERSKVQVVKIKSKDDEVVDRQVIFSVDPNVRTIFCGELYKKYIEDFVLGKTVDLDGLSKDEAEEKVHSYFSNPNVSQPDIDSAALLRILLEDALTHIS